MSIKSLGPTAATIGDGFFLGVLIGYALKKVIKLVAVIVGLFLAVLAYLQYHQIANINWNKLQQVSEGAITKLSNAIIQILPLVVIVYCDILFYVVASGQRITRYYYYS
jgi:uncharacterized membrane protein (Fun14 family)